MGVQGLRQVDGLNLGQDTGLWWESLAIGMEPQPLSVSEPRGEAQTQGPSPQSGTRPPHPVGPTLRHSHAEPDHRHLPTLHQPVSQRPLPAHPFQLPLRV